MLPFFALLALLAAGVYVVSRRLASDGRWRADAGAILLLFAAGLGAGAPFLTSRAIGTGEAYNYSLALADAVTQMRAGETPPLVGQTEYAFNGRIHPLRTAPYLFYLARAIDVVTDRHLSFWQLQNLSLALSLMAAFHACYLGLRWGAGCPRLPAVVLSLAYGFSPALLAIAYWFDLFMTVHAAPFLPLAVAACVRQARAPGWRADAILAIALAATWLAHPPVAVWITATTGLVRLVLFLRRPAWRALAGLVVAALLGGLLAGFVFASVLTLPGMGAGSMDGARAVLWHSLQAAFPGCLLPIPNATNNLSNLQFGYGFWLLLGVAIVGVWRKSAATDGAGPARAGLLAATVTLLMFTLPVPGLTPALWKAIPDFFVSLTSIWPMQRLYLVAGACVVFAASAPLAALWTGPRRAATGAIVALTLAWILWQAWVPVRRGFDSRWTDAASRQAHLDSNIDLTATSYAFLELPPGFVNGVMDPREGFSLILPGATEGLPVPPPAAPALATGRLTWPEKSDAPAFTLEPGRRYLITFTFTSPPVVGELLLTGPSLARHYTLPEAGPSDGFGMDPQHRHSLTVWTSQTTPEEIRLHFVPAASDSVVTLANYDVRVIDPATGPILVKSLLPLQCLVTSTAAKAYLETCRRYLPGYMATVNGQPAEVLRSPRGQLMVPVSAGRSGVEIRYVGSPWVRRAFVAGAIAWGLVWVALALEVVGLNAAWWARRPRLIVAILVIVAGAYAGWRGVSWWRQIHVTGPVAVVFRLPPPSEFVAGRAEPLLVTGHTGAGDFAYVRYIDAGHVRFGLDHWGVGGEESAPVALDHAEIHRLEVRFGSLYPDADDPRWKEVAPTDRAARKNTMALVLDGREILRVPMSAHPTTREEIRIGVNPIGGSTCAEKFSGTLLAVEHVTPAHP